jgi:hypothetical protein
LLVSFLAATPSFSIRGQVYGDTGRIAVDSIAVPSASASTHRLRR